jgi:hypothetical protein
MNKKQLFLTSALLALSTSYAYAQTLQLNNGDSLEVELIQETDITLTYLHTVLGKQTIQKSDIRNFSELNLIGVDKVREGAEGQAGLKLYEAEKRQEAALIEVNDAKNQLEVDKKELTTATGVGVKIAEQKELASENRLVTAEKSLVTANAAVVAAKAKLQTTKNISVASEQVNLAKSELKQAKKELDNADSKSEAQAESKVETAEDKVETAKENLLLAEGAAKTAKGEKINNGFMGTGIFKDWDSSINFGLSGASDRTNNVTLNLGFNALYEDNSRRWIFKSSYYYDAEGADGSSGQDNVNDNQANITLIRDWFFSDSAWFAYASTIYDYDNFKDWNHRIQVSTGPGYQLFKTDTWEIAARTGLTGVFEFDIEVDGLQKDNTQNLEAMIGFEAKWHITAKQRFIISNYMYPSITNGGEFKNLANVSWIHDIDLFEGMALKVNIKDEYNTSETFVNEFKYNFSILWAF